MDEKDLEDLRNIIRRNQTELGDLAAAVERPVRKRKKQSLPAYLTEEELTKLFHVIKNPRDRAIFCVAYHRGLRASELGMIQLADYHRDSGRLMIKRLTEFRII
jgi:integrase